MRRAITALASGALIAALAGPTLAAFPSGETPEASGADSMWWTGNGAADGALDSSICRDEGGEALEPYLHWIMTTDGGSLDPDAAAPVLYLNDDFDTPYPAESKASKAAHFYTPYYAPDPATLTAEAFFTVLTTGGGGWILTISHGCAPQESDGADLTVAATAAPAFTRSYGWTIAKSADPTRVAQVGGSATFGYVVDAAQTGVTDGDWTVTGTIAVHNPNAFDVELTGAGATVDDGGDCSVSGDTAQTVPAEGDSDGLAYSCTYASRPDPLDGTVTVTVTWDETAAGTPTGTAGATADFTFGDPTTRENQTVTLTDSYSGNLGSLTATDEAPYTSASYTYARTIEMPTWDCVTYENVATIVETEQTAGASVQACGPARTGALTMGFWGNRNGQAIIVVGSAAGTTCASVGWLRGFAPFTDLGATSTCTDVAKYAGGVFKLANASGASMNAMLKGQMLATAFDVYFSDPDLGGNRIGAREPIGGVSVDLTLICTDLSCTAYEDSSSVFGGSPKTVLEMLEYASSAPTYGGSTWYGNVKAMQELAKDAFDAINNQKAFAD